VISDRIGDASSLTGLLLVLVTLFTSEQSRSLEAARQREGGAPAGSRSRIRTLAVALGVVTGISILALSPLVIDIASECCVGPWDPVRPVFVLVWILLFPLIGWQVSIARGAHRLSN